MLPTQTTAVTTSGWAKSTIPNSSLCPEDSNVVQFEPTQLAPLPQPTFTHLAEPAHPGARLGVAAITMCQKITTTYSCGHTSVTYVKTSGCSGEAKKCPHLRPVASTNDDICSDESDCDKKPKPKRR